MKKAILVISTVLFALFACNKEEENYGLPPATQSGEDTFGCLINGKPWVAHLGMGIIDPTVRHLDASFDEYNVGSKPGIHDFWMSARIKNDSTRDILRFSILPVVSTGIISDTLFKLNTNNIEYSNYRLKKLYILDTLYPINFNITCIDTIRNFITGTFDFRMRRISDSTDVLDITHGRFDAVYQPD